MNSLHDRSLSEWYLAINRIYFDKNFNRNKFELFAHLSEIIGGLSSFATGKDKNSNKIHKFVPKAIAWLMVLCGKMGVRDFTDIIWLKFPSVCPYCLESPHDTIDCKNTAATSQINWDKLSKTAIAKVAGKPKTLADWQRMFFQIYQVNGNEDYSFVFGKLTEEMGELAETLRISQIAPGYFISEASDVFAWLMHLQNLIELRNKVEKANMGNALNRYFADSYPDKCLDCGNYVCNCRSILPGSLGRISSEIPDANLSKSYGGILIPIDEAIKLFSINADELRIGASVLPVNMNLINEIKKIATTLDGVLLSLNTSDKYNKEELKILLDQINNLASSQIVTQKSIDSLTEYLSHLPSDQKQILLSVLGNIGSTPWVLAITRLIS